MDLVDALLALGNAIDFVPEHAVNSAHRKQMVVALNSIRAMLEPTASGHGDRLDAMDGAKYANAVSSLLSQVQMSVPGPERNCMESLAETICESVTGLRDGSLEPPEAVRLRELIGAAVNLLQRGPV